MNENLYHLGIGSIAGGVGATAVFPIGLDFFVCLRKLGIWKLESTRVISIIKSIYLLTLIIGFFIYINYNCLKTLFFN